MKKNKGSFMEEDLPDGVVLRRKEVPPSTPFGRPGGPSPYSFMRRSCTFVAESSLGLRKSANRASGPPPVRPWINGKSSSVNEKTTPKKDAKDRKNLALQVRQKKESLDDSPDGQGRVSNGSAIGTPRSGGGSGRVSRLVGGLRAWSSTEDVRQSVVGAFRHAWSRRDSQEKGLTPLKETNTPVKLKKSPAANNTKPTTPNSKPLKISKSMPPPKDTKVPKSAATNKETKNFKDKNFPKDKKLSKDRKSVSDNKLVKPRGGVGGGGSTKENKSSSSLRDRGSGNANGGVDSTDSRWFRHIQEAQEAYSARDTRNRRPHPNHLEDPLPDAPGSVDDNVEPGPEEGLDDSSNPVITPSVKVEEGGKQDESSPSPNSSSLQPPGSPESLSKKTEVDGAVAVNSGPSVSSTSSSPASGRRLQEVQIIQIVEGPTLIQPSEVKVSQGVVLSAQPVLTPIEHLRRKDLKIRQALEEKQHIIADILNIPQEHFENVADMAGEPAVGNKEPRELVLAAMYQAKCLQESLNEALNIRESDIVAARANNESPSNKTHLPLYQAPMTKLMSISTSLSSQLTSLLNLISERDDERERMRKELVASRERLHLFHMKQNSLPSSSQPSNPPSFSGVPGTPPSATSPHTSRPNSFISVTSSAADHSDTPEHHDTDEESRGDVAKRNSHNEEETEESKEDSVIETFEDAVSSEAEERTETVEGSDKLNVVQETVVSAVSETDTT